MSVCRLYVVLLLCFGLTVLSVYGEVPLDDVVFPESLSSLNKHSSWNSDNERQTPTRTVRQGNRRPRPPVLEEDPFSGLEPQGNNRPSGNQGQWSNQRPNQQQGFGNRPSGNQNQWGTNGNNQGQNQWGTNGNNQGQNQWGTNGNNQGQNQWGTRPPTQPTDNPDPVQTSTTSSNIEQANEELRNTCNTSCREIITNEYNPVCGSDSQTYQNRRFLDCVANCGIRTEFSYIGTCVTTTERITRA